MKLIIGRQQIIEVSHDAIPHVELGIDPSEAKPKNMMTATSRSSLRWPGARVDVSCGDVLPAEALFDRINTAAIAARASPPAEKPQ
jgi:hypothetical protein